MDLIQKIQTCYIEDRQNRKQVIFCSVKKWPELPLKKRKKLVEKYMTQNKIYGGVKLYKFEKIKYSYKEDKILSLVTIKKNNFLELY